MNHELLFFAAFVLLALLYFAQRRGDTTPAEARRLVEHGARLLDVRSAAEFAAGHLPGAVNVPVQELEQRLGELGRDGRAIVVYCRSGVRSGRAARLLRNAGYAAVHDLGAMSRW